MKKKKTIEEMLIELKPHIDYICPSYDGWTISLNEIEISDGYDYINAVTIRDALERCYIELKKRKIKI